MKLLLHTCCGPCFLGVWEDLGTKEIDVTNYFYNPNIYPEEEYKKRLENLKIVAKDKTSGVIASEYDPESYDRMVTKNDNEVRCLGCYRLRLEKTAEYARNNSYDAFSTTLLVSPYQKHEELRRIGEEVALKFGLKFYYTDWRPYFRSGQDEAKIIPIYRQKYCGCKYSLHPQK